MAHSTNSVFDNLIGALEAVYELLKVQLASEEACANNAAGTWEDIADFADDIVQRVMMRILKAIMFAIRTLVVTATPDFTILPLGAGILNAFPVLAKFFGEAARTGAKMLQMFNNKIKSMESRDQAKFVSGAKLLGSMNRMAALANAINFIGEIIGITEEVGIDEEALVSQVEGVANRYAEREGVNTKATDPGSLTSEEVANTMGSVSYTESIMAKAESAGIESYDQPAGDRPYGYTSTSSITFYGPDGRPLTPSGTINIDPRALPGYDPKQEAMWEDVISLHEGTANAPRLFDDAYSASFWHEHGFASAEDVVAEFGEDALSPHTFKAALRSSNKNTRGDRSATASSEEEPQEEQQAEEHTEWGGGIGNIEDRNTDDPYVDDPEGGLGVIIDQLMANLGDFVGDIIDAIDSEGASEQLADELEEADSQAQDARKNNKVIRIIEGLL